MKKLFVKYRLWKFVYFIKGFSNLWVLPPRIYLQLKYFKYHKRFINFSSPTTLNEKIQCLKLYCRSNDLSKFADKEESKKIIKKILGPKGVLETLEIYKSSHQISFENLKYPCVIKTNHGSGDFSLLKTCPNITEQEKIKFQLFKSMNRSLSFEKKEFQYKNIDPKILVEKMLLDSEGKIPPDYKVHCFNGSPEFIYVTTGRDGDTFRGVYSLDWEPLPFIWSHFDKNGKTKYRFQNNLIKPKNLKQIIKTAKDLANTVNVPYVRVDLFNIEQKRLVFGEFTFHHMSGFAPITPFERDLKLGSKLYL